jgi:hypothetical protein
MQMLMNITLLSAAVALMISAGSSASERPDPTRLHSLKDDCITRLTVIGAKSQPPVAIPTTPYPACKIVEPIVLISVKDPSQPGNSIAFPDGPMLSCAMAEKLAKFSVSAAAPLAKSLAGSAITSISTGPGYECRPRNRQAGAKISSHGQGNAVDILTIKFESGRSISVEKPDGGETIKFLTALRFSACAAFNTVLGPGSDAAHANHIHIDLEPRGKTGKSKFCQ